MSIHYKCDQCGDDIASPVSSNRINRRLERVSVEVHVAVDETWNGGQVCKHCVLQAVAEGSDR